MTTTDPRACYTLDDIERFDDVEELDLLPGHAIPTRLERESLVPGFFAKLIFLSDDGGERMWVEVVRRGMDGTYTGRLDNEALFTPIDVDAVVKFRPEHVLEILRIVGDPKEWYKKQLLMGPP